MRSYLVDVTDPKNNGVRYINNWKEIAPMIHCDTFDVSKVVIEDHVFRLYVDDEGLVDKKLEDILWGVYNEKAKRPLIAGSILVTSATVDSNGDEIDLTDEEIKLIKKHICKIKVNDKLTCVLVY